MHARPCLVVSLLSFARRLSDPGRELRGYIWCRIVCFSWYVPVVFPSHVPPHDVVIGALHSPRQRRAAEGVARSIRSPRDQGRSARALRLIEPAHKVALSQTR